MSDLIALGATEYHLFTTRQYSTGAPFTLAGTPVVSVYEENNLTQITSGVSLSVDYDSVTGLNQLTVVATSANGFELGKRYYAVITTGTVDSVSVVGETVWSFQVESAAQRAQRLLGEALYGTGGGLIDTTTTGNTTGRINLTDVLDAQVADADLVGSRWLVYDATNAQWCEVVVYSVQSARLFNVRTAAAGDVMDFTVATGDYVIFLGHGVVTNIDAQEDGTGLTEAGGTGDQLTAIPTQDANVVQISGDATAADNLEAAYDGTGYDVGGIDVSELNGIVDDLLEAGRLDALIDAIKAKTDSLTFTNAGEVDANTVSINDVTVIGVGTSGNKWRA